MKFGCNRLRSSGEKSFEIVDGRTMEPAYTISYPEKNFGSGELKINNFHFLAECFKQL